MTRRRLLTVGAIVLAVASPSGATVALGTTTLTCKAKLATANENLASTSDAYHDAVDHLENARPLIRQEIVGLRKKGVSWAAIKASPLGRAFYGPLLGR